MTDYETVPEIDEMADSLTAGFPNLCGLTVEEYRNLTDKQDEALRTLKTLAYMLKLELRFRP